MLTLQVKDMTCGHCASTITKAVKAIDKDATVRIDLRQLVADQRHARDAHADQEQ